MSKCFFHFLVRYLDFSHDPCHDTYKLKSVVKRLGKTVVLLASLLAMKTEGADSRFAANPVNHGQPPNSGYRSSC